MNDNDIASKLTATIHILFIFGRIIVLFIRIRSNSKDALFGTDLITGSTCQCDFYTKHKFNDKHLTTDKTTQVKLQY